MMKSLIKAFCFRYKTDVVLVKEKVEQGFVENRAIHYTAARKLDPQR